MEECKIRICLSESTAKMVLNYMKDKKRILFLQSAKTASIPGLQNSVNDAQKSSLTLKLFLY